MSNRRELLEIYGAAIETGLTFVAINWHLGETEIAYILEDSDAKALIVDGQFADSARAAADRVSLPESARFSIDERAGFRAFAELRGGHSGDALARTPRGPDHVLHVGDDGTAQGSAQAVPGDEPRRHRAADGDRLARADASVTERRVAGRHRDAGLWPVLPRGPDRVGGARARRGWPRGRDGQVDTRRISRRGAGVSGHAREHGADDVPPFARAARRGSRRTPTSRRCSW